MPTRLDISNFKCFNQLRNGADFSTNTSEFTSNLVGNVGELVKVVYDATFNYFSNASLVNSWEVKSGKITRANGNFQNDDSLLIGDVFLFFAVWENRDTATPEFTGTITGFADSGKTILYSISGSQTSVGTLTNVGFICNPQTAGNEHTAMINRFGLVPNDDEYNNNSLVTGNSQSYSVVGMSGITAPISGVFEGIYKDSQTGSLTASIISNNADYSVTYQIAHIFEITPSYIVGYLQNMQNGTAPELFAGDASLKYTFEIELRKSKTDAASKKTVRYDSVEGSVGWFNENFNGSQSIYSVSAITYEDTASTLLVSALQPAKKTTLSFTLSKDIAFSAGQVVAVYIQYLPLNESDYTDTATDYAINFLTDSIRLVEGAGDIAGAGIIKRGNALLSGNDISVEIDAEYTASQAEKVNGGYYRVSVACENNALSAGNSDRVMAIVAVSTYQAIAPPENLSSFSNMNLLVHDEVLGVDAGEASIQAWNEDGLLMDFAFSIDLAKQAVIDSIEFALVAYKTADDTFFRLDSYIVNTEDFDVLSGVQQIEVDESRGYNLTETSQFNFAKITTAARVGDVQSYTGAIGQKITWQEDIANPDADIIFYDATKPNNNLNYKASNYSGVNGYVIKLVIILSMRGANDLGVLASTTEVGTLNTIAVNDYAVPDDAEFIDGTIEFLDTETLEPLGELVYGERKTFFKTSFTPSSTVLEGLWAIHRLYNKDSGGLIEELSNILGFPFTNILIPREGASNLSVYEEGGKIVTECLVDNSKLNKSARYAATARIERSIINFLLGNAQVFGGSFETDRIVLFPTPDINAATTYNINIIRETTASSFFLYHNSFTGGNTKGETILVLPDGRIRYEIQNNVNGILRAETDGSIPLDTATSIIITYDGSTNASGVEIRIGGVLQTLTTIDTLTIFQVGVGAQTLIGGRVASSSFRFKGKMKIFEKLNKVASPAEIAGAELTGSFVGGGIPHNSGDYLLALDFNKQDGEVPTTYADTPFYDVVVSGTADYEQYL